MKRLLKKLTAALAAAVLIFSFLPAAFADGETLGGSADFDFVSGIYTLSIGTDDGCYMHGRREYRHRDGAETGSPSFVQRRGFRF